MAEHQRPPGDLICTNPFEWFEIHPDGQVFLCCPAWLKAAVGNLLTEPVEAIWNSPRAREIRRAVLNGTFARCNKKRCPRLAAPSPPVMPRDAITDAEVRDAVAGRKVVLPYGPKKLNLCFDRSCNLACPSCRSALHIARGPEAQRVDLLMGNLITGAGPSAEELIVSGTGDPFGSPAFRTLLRRIRPQDFPRLQRVHLHSNGQLWDAAMWQSMAAIHPLVRTAEISVDAATAATYAQNRRGGDFEKLLDNLAYLASLPIAVKISFVVQQNNFREIPAFAQLGARHGFAVYFSQLVNWGTFSREEFRRRAVHLPDHPEHRPFLAILKEVAALDHVDIGNLSPLLTEAPSAIS